MLVDTPSTVHCLCKLDLLMTYSFGKTVLVIFPILYKTLCLNSVTIMVAAKLVKIRPHPLLSLASLTFSLCKGRRCQTNPLLSNILVGHGPTSHGKSGVRRATPNYELSRGAWSTISARLPVLSEEVGHGSA